jgi:uncharacterized protein (DUF1697 family)
MAPVVVFLRGVNLVSRNRVSMPVLREALEEAGFEGVRSYVQSGNVVLTTSRAAKAVPAAVAAVVEERFGIEIAVVVRTRAQLAAVVKRNPLARVATNPKLYQVTFLEKTPAPAALEKLEAAAVGGETVLRVGRELYSWHPAGMGRSKLGRMLSAKSLGVIATSRNWATVTAVLALADEP